MLKNDVLKEFPKEEHNLVIPGIYRHFKYTEKGITNNYKYVTLLKSEPRELTQDEMINADECVIAKYTESEHMAITYKIDGKWYHPKKCCDEYLVFYKSLYVKKGYDRFARPYKMFMEEVPEGKENPTGQKYRFELVK